jgi:hypothetical protein
MRAPRIVVGNPIADTCPGLTARLKCVEINALIFQRSPQPFDENIVDPAALAVHRNFDLRVFQNSGELEAGELVALDALLFVKRRFWSR